jgi:chromosome segregation ATPase
MASLSNRTDDEIPSVLQGGTLFRGSARSSATSIDVLSTEAALRQIEDDHAKAHEAKSVFASLQAVTAQRDTLCRELSRLKEELSRLTQTKRESDLLLVATQHELDEFRQKDAIISKENLRVLQAARDSEAHVRDHNTDLKAQNDRLKNDLKKFAEQTRLLHEQNSLLTNDLASMTGELGSYSIRTGSLFTHYEYR